MKQKPHYLGHRKRLRARMAKDPSQLADYEVLELLLGYALIRTDTKPLAKKLLSEFRTIKGVFAARDEDLVKIDGVGEGLVNFWRLWRETWARIEEAPLTEKQVLNTPRKVAELARARLGLSASEEFWLVLLDNKNRLVGWERITRGTVDQVPVFPREVLTLALTRHASGVILVHNHPGGDPRPSAQDVDLTRRIQKAAKELGVRILDHVVVADDDYFSFQAQGLI